MATSAHETTTHLAVVTHLTTTYYIYICCNDTLSPRYSFLKCYGGTECTQNWKDDHTRCCRGTPYNVFTEMCCDGKVNERGDSTSCCSEVPYNFYTEICCSNELSPRQNRNSCCGNMPYNRYTQRCSNNMVSPRGSSTSSSHSRICYNYGGYRYCYGAGRK